MLISVSHSLAILLLQTHISHREMYSQTNYIEQDCTKNQPA